MLSGGTATPSFSFRLLPGPNSYDRLSISQLREEVERYSALLAAGTEFLEVPGPGRYMHRIQVREELALVQSVLSRKEASSTEPSTAQSSGESSPWLLVGGLAVVIYLATRK
jgi:hypothetical protein